jgi:hypothetical protein
METLKLGSTGEDVKVLQEFLNITVDGVFGPETQKTVKIWQATYGLTADGVVGPKTQAAMGLIDTDLADTPDKLSDILVIEKSYLPKGEYFVGPTKKQWLFLHHTAGWHNPIQTIEAWGRDTRGEVATEFVIGGQSVKGDDNTRDGVLVQAFPEGGWGWHLGTGRGIMHSNSVGVEVCNFGQLTKGGYTKNKVWVPLKPNSFYTYVGVEVHPSQIVELKKAFRGHKFWHKYSNKQLDILKDLIYYVANRDGIDVRKGLPAMVKSIGADAFDFLNVPHVSANPGLWAHTNVLGSKTDMFPQQELLDLLVSL